MTDNFELVDEWRGLAVGDLIHICWPKDQEYELIERIEYFSPRESELRPGEWTVEWAILGCRRHWRNGRVCDAVGNIDFHVNAGGDPVFRVYAPTEELLRLGYWPYTDYPVEIVQPGPGRVFRQRPLFEVTS